MLKGLLAHFRGRELLVSLLQLTLLGSQVVPAEARTMGGADRAANTRHSSESQPDSSAIDALANEGIARLNDSNLNEARRLWDEMIAKGGWTTTAGTFSLRLARHYFALDRISDSELVLRAAISRTDRNDPSQRESYLILQKWLAQDLTSEGQHTEAEETLKSGLRWLLENAPTDINVNRYRITLAELFHNYDPLEAQRMHDEIENSGLAESWNDWEHVVAKDFHFHDLRDAESILRSKVGDRYDGPSATRLLAGMFNDQNKYQEAEALYKQDTDNAKKNFGERSRAYNVAHEYLTLFYVEHGAPEKVEKECIKDNRETGRHSNARLFGWTTKKASANLLNRISESYQFDSPTIPKNSSPTCIERRLERARVLLVNGNLAAAQSSLESLHSEVLRSPPSETKALVLYFNSIVYERQNNFAKAEVLCDELIGLIQQCPASMGADLCKYLETLTVRLKLRDETFAAVPEFQAIRKIRQQAWGASAPEVADADFMTSIVLNIYGWNRPTIDDYVYDSWIKICSNSPASVKRLNKFPQFKPAAEAFMKRRGGSWESAYMYLAERLLVLSQMISLSGERLPFVNDSLAWAYICTVSDKESDADKLDRNLRIVAALAHSQSYSVANEILADARTSVKSGSLDDARCAVVAATVSARQRLSEVSFQQSRKAVSILRALHAESKPEIRGDLAAALQCEAEVETELAQSSESSSHSLAAAATLLAESISLLEKQADDKYQLGLAMIDRIDLAIKMKQLDTAREGMAKVEKLSASMDGFEAEMTKLRIDAELGQLALATGDRAEARKHLVRALDLDLFKADPYGKLNYCMQLDALAALDAGGGDSDSASVEALRAASAMNVFLDSSFMNLPFAQQCYFSAFAHDQIGYLMSCCQRGEALNRAYGYVLKWKGLLVRALSPQVNRSTDPQFLDERRELKKARQALVDFISRSDLNHDANYQRRLNDLLQSELNAEEIYIGSRTSFVDLSDPMKDETAKTFASRLQSGEAFVDVVAYAQLGETRRRRYAAVVSVKGQNPQFVDIGDAAAVEDGTKDWLASVQQDSEPSLRTTAVAARSLTLVGSARKKSVVSDEVSSRQTLERLVWQPVSKAIPNGTNKIVVCVDGALAKIPWNLFCVSGDSKLIVSEVDSPREFVALKDGKKQLRGIAGKMLIVGDIAFGDAGITALPATKIEVDEVKRSASSQGLSQTVLTGEQPTKTRLLSELPGAAYVHLATHGFFSELKANPPADSASGVYSRGPSTRSYNAETFFGSDPLLNSGIIVAKTNEVTGGNASGYNTHSQVRSAKKSKSTSVNIARESSGVLRTEELLDLDLSKCRLVVLSACQTGLGEEVSGQGLIGLRSAIMAAGAQGMLMSLWKVDDQATCALMNEFYGNMFAGKMPPAQALLAAQRAIKSKPQWSSPYYWAPWVLAGE